MYHIDIRENKALKEFLAFDRRSVIVEGELQSDRMCWRSLLSAFVLQSGRGGAAWTASRISIVRIAFFAILTCFALGTDFGAGAGAAAAKTVPVSTVMSVSVDGDGEAATFELLLSKGVPAEIFTLGNPYRVIIDLPDVAFKLPATAGRDGKGLIAAFRYGLFAEGKARVVIDTRRPVLIEKAGMTRVKGGILLKLHLQGTDAATFGSGTGAPSINAAAQSATPPQPEERRKSAGAKPVIVVDAGHGGIDPGAISLDGISEKTVVLAVAKELQQVLRASGRYDVRMTRSKDLFVSLDQRLAFSADADADLFISLHADSIEERNFAESVRGATIYTLSERASDEQARQMAEKENASDLIAGLETASIGGSDQVKSILIDLLKRETSNFSTDFSNVLLRSLKPNIALSKDPQRSAAFKVLKQANAPSVLVELGYMSNSKDEAQMTSRKWQKQVASAIGGAVDVFFNRRKALRR